MRWLLAAALWATSGCATMPDLDGGALPLGRTGWQMSGGADFQRRCWYVLFSRPFGAKEEAVAKSWK